MPNETPYRASAEVAARVASPKLVVAWSDHEKSNRLRVYLRGYYAFLAAAFALGLLALVSQPLAAGCAAALVAYVIYQRRTAVEPGCTLEVSGATLYLTRAGQEVAVTVALSSLRDVEIERKSVQRVSLHQGIGDAVPSTALSGDLDVARIVLVPDGDAPRVRLTEEYAPVFVCMERFGKVRSFLRSHGWKPVAERE